MVLSKLDTRLVPGITLDFDNDKIVGYKQVRSLTEALNAEEFKQATTPDKDGNVAIKLPDEQLKSINAAFKKACEGTHDKSLKLMVQSVGWKSNDLILTPQFVHIVSVISEHKEPGRFWGTRTIPEYTKLVETVSLHPEFETDLDWRKTDQDGVKVSGTIDASYHFKGYKETTVHAISGDLGLNTTNNGKVFSRDDAGDFMMHTCNSEEIAKAPNKSVDALASAMTNGHSGAHQYGDQDGIARPLTTIDPAVLAAAKGRSS